jgi:hypothetical protein
MNIENYSNQRHICSKNLFKCKIMHSLVRRNLGEYIIKLLSHKLVANGPRQLPARPIVLDRLLHLLHMFLLGPHIIINDHLHIKSIVSFLFQSFLQPLILLGLSLVYLFEHLRLDLLDEFL